jgi:hypothetical protein
MKLILVCGLNLEQLLCRPLNLEGSFPLKGEQAVRPYTSTRIARAVSVAGSPLPERTFNPASGARFRSC